MSGADKLPGPPRAVGLWAASKAQARVRGAMALGLEPGDVVAKASGLTDSRKVAGIRYVVRPRR